MSVDSGASRRRLGGRIPPFPAPSYAGLGIISLSCKALDGGRKTFPPARSSGGGEWASLPDSAAFTTNTGDSRQPTFELPTPPCPDSPRRMSLTATPEWARSLRIASPLLGCALTLRPCRLPYMSASLQSWARKSVFLPGSAGSAFYGREAPPRVTRAPPIQPGEQE